MKTPPPEATHGSSPDAAVIDSGVAGRLLEERLLNAEPSDWTDQTPYPEASAPVA
jgi:hypothetical protein